MNLMRVTPLSHCFNMKTIVELFKDAWQKKEERKWDFVYIMVDLHGVVLNPNYHSENDLRYISEHAEECLKNLSDRDDVKLILWSSSHDKEIESVRKWMASHGIIFDFVNENPLEKNTKYADFSKKYYFSIILDDKAGFEPSDWQDLLNGWINKRKTDTDGGINQIIDDYQNTFLEYPEWFGGLTGNAYFSKNANDGEIYEDSYYFYFGPEDNTEETTCLHDSLSCNKWLKDTLKTIEKKWDVKFFIGEAENYHSMVKKGLTKRDVEYILDDIEYTLTQSLPRGVKLSVHD